MSETRQAHWRVCCTLCKEPSELLHGSVNVHLEKLPELDLWENVLPDDLPDALKTANR